MKSAPGKSLPGADYSCFHLTRYALFQSLNVFPGLEVTEYRVFSYGFMNKREFSEFLGVSRPTLDRYFDTIHAKPPIVSKAENNRLKKKYCVSNDSVS